jgi:hypothetical protein
LNGIGFTDTLPSGLIVATPNGFSGSCGNGTITASAGSNSISLTGASLAATGSCTFSLEVIGTTAGIKNNTTSAVTSTEGGTGLPASATLTVVIPPTLTKAFADSQIGLSFGSTQLSFTITNPAANPIPLSGIAFTDTLPAGLIVLEPDNGLTGTCEGVITAAPGSNNISLSGETLAPGASCTFAVLVNGAAIGVQDNTTSPVTALGGTIVGLPASASTSVNDLFFFWFFAA